MSPVRKARFWGPTAALCLVSMMLMFPASSLNAQEGARAEFIFGYSAKTLPDVDLRDATAALKIYVNALAKKLQISAESRIYEDSGALLKDAQSGQVYLFSLRALDYLRSHSYVETAPGIIGVRAGKVTERLVFLIREEGQAADLNDLQGKKIALLKGDDVSVLFLNLLLLRGGHPEMEGYFSAIDMKSSPSQALLAVFFSQADACIVGQSAFLTAGELNPQVTERLKIVAQSPEFIGTVAFFRNSMDKEFIRKVIELSGTLKDDPHGRQVLTLFKVEDLRPFNESNLENLRAMLDEYDRLRAAK